MWDLLGSGIKSIVSCTGMRILYHWEIFFKDEPHSSLQLGEHWPRMPGAVQEAREPAKLAHTARSRSVGGPGSRPREDGLRRGGADPMKGNSWR